MTTVSKFLLLFLCSYYCSHVAYAQDPPSYVTGSLVKTEDFCSEPKATPSTTGGATVALHSRQGPCSPASTKETRTVEEILRSDQLRASYIQRKLSATRSGGADDQKLEATVPIALGTALDTLQYVINVSIGTPAVAQTMMIDTGSDVSWVHCKPCSPCHAQASPIFDPSESTTYSALSCTSAACARLGADGSAGCSSAQPQCQYVVRYVDGSNTTGTYSSDTLTLGPSVVTGFQFGCSRVASGSGGKTAGLIGLGGDAQSLVSQTSGTFGTAFSYCLPPPRTSAGFLTLGATSGGGGGNFTTTRMYRTRQAPTFYLVLLEAIKVGGRIISVPPSVFAGGSLMDSGTIITRLPSRAYSALASAFKARMTQYPRAPPVGILDTCFDFSDQTTVRVPAISLVFDGGAEIDLDFDGIIILDSCLAFAPNDDDGDSSTGIIGNVQQRTFEVLYDVGGSTVGFRPGAC